MTQKRRTSDLLPEVLQTDILRKFLAATADHLFQPGNVEYVNGYVGERPGYAQQSDAYVQEQDTESSAYQVSSVAVSKNSSNEDITHTLFYTDLINKLRFQGALTNDHNRLFSAEYYSWGAPFDLDKWLNFINYVWLPEGPNRISLLDDTDISQIEMTTTYTYTGRWQREDQAGTTQVQTDPLVFSTGMKIRFAADLNTRIRSVDYLVDGVGRRIKLIPDNYLSSLAWENPKEWDSVNWDGSAISLVPTYVTIARGSKNGNPWSVGNRWFHRDVAVFSGTDPLYVQGARAQRPILEFDAHIRMSNTGTRSRGYVNVVDACTTSLDQILGKTSYTVYENCDRTGTGVTLDDNNLILMTNLRDPANPDKLDQNLNNKIYKVSNLRSGGTIALQVMSNNGDATGAPVQGDCVFVLQGDISKPQISQSNINSTWYYNQNTWHKGQSRQTAVTSEPTAAELAVWNQAPLFDLFDHRGNSLSDPAVYPNSSFAGCSLVQYVQGTGAPDTYLGFPLQYKDVSPSDYMFEVTLETQTITYLQESVNTPIPGMRFYQTQDPVTSQEVYLNNWHSSSSESRQYVVNEYWGTGEETTYKIDQAPDLQAPAPPAIRVEVAGQLLTLNEHYVVQDQTVQLKQPVPEGGLVKIRTWGGLHNHLESGYFELPKNLVCNPLNEPLTQFSRSDLISHAQSVLENQLNFQGSSVGSNNWRDTAQDQSVGTQILQHRASLLKLMALNAPSAASVFETSNSVVDPFVAIQWAQNEYLRFYNKMINTLVNLYNRQAFTGVEGAEQWLNTALAQVNVGKTQSSAWANSGIESTQGAYCSMSSNQNTWVPTTATRLGITPAYVPQVFVDESQPGNPLSLRCHNGAILVLKDLAGNSLGQISSGKSQTSDIADLTHPVAQAWLLFEQKMFDSMPSAYLDPERHMPVDPRTLFSAKYRRTSYTRAEQLQLMMPAFQKWSTFNQVDLMRNTEFDLADPWTWNYGNCRDLDGESVPGHWRGMYYHFYDTDTPHTDPWHMLGFSQKPSWWDAEYGAAPYTSGNTRMWDHLAEGRIARGARAGVHTAWARPGLLRCLPVDSSGQLLSPNLTGQLENLPSAVEAAADWKFGDRSPQENIWLTTVDHDFVYAALCYQTRPAQTIEYLWDGVRQVQLFADQTYSQWVNSDTMMRELLSKSIMHRENPQQVRDSSDTSSYRGSCGIQHWISEKLVSENLNVTRYLGDLIRGTNVQLGYKLNSFVNSNSLRVLVDSFGLGNTNSLLLPQEDISVELLRTPSVKESFYTGVIVEFRGSQVGWRVIGYDSVDPFFTIIPSNVRGARNTVVIGNQRVTDYSQGLNTTQRVPYGTVLRTRQEVYDLLMGLGRYQQSQGWVFDQFDEAASRVRDWGQSAREFLFWSQGPWSEGTYITLSPLATLAKYQTEFGLIQSVGTLVNGTYSVLDRSGVTIPLKNLDMLRIDDEISIRPLGDQGLYGVRVYVTSVTHALLINNETIFGDLIYSPLLNQRQSRFRMLGYRSMNWQGRLDAPGYMITQTVQVLGDDVKINNQIIPNFEKSVEDLRKMFEVDPSSTYSLVDNPQLITSSITQSVEPRLNQMATHLVGYQDRDYLNQLLVDRTVAFQFYQGMIQQKGTSESIQRLLRNTTVLSLDQQLQVFEEFAFRSAYYGANSQLYQVDVQLVENQVVSDPQLVEFTGEIDYDDLKDQKISITPRDARKLNSTLSLPPMKLRTQYGSEQSDLPTSGYVLLDEVTHTVRDQEELLTLYTNLLNQSFDQNTNPLRRNDRVWQMIHPSRDWDVYKVVLPTWRISYTEPSTVDSFATTVYTTQDHGLQAGDPVIIFGVVNAGASINNTFTTTNITARSFDIQISTTNLGNGGTVWIYKSVRFAPGTNLNNQAMRRLISYRELVYVDGTRDQPWVVYRRGSTRFFPHRTEQLSVDVRLLLGSRLYELSTLQTRTLLTLWHPMKNQLPGVFSREITYRTPYDPAQYTDDPTGVFGTNAPAAWGASQVGQVWWDLSTTRFLNYEIGSDSYRRKHWGSIAPGTSIDIYEWVRSPVPPASWAGLVAQGASLQSVGGSGTASGEVSSVDAPYVTSSMINDLGQVQPVYYFWITRNSSVPDLPHRRISTQQLMDLITNPQNSGIRWWSAVNPTSVLVGGVGADLDGSNMVLQITYTHSSELMNTHKQYSLIRPGDPQSNPTAELWHKIQDSLVEFNSAGDSVPNLRLPLMQRAGVEIRPSQTLFLRADQARAAFVQGINQLITTSDTPVVNDPGRSGWLMGFLSEEPPPPANNIKDPVQLASQTVVSAAHLRETLITDQLVISVSTITTRIGVNWVVSGVGLGIPAVVTNITQVSGELHITISQLVELTQGATYVFREIHTYYKPSVGNQPDQLWVTQYGSAPLLIDGDTVSLNQRVLFKNQLNSAENGIYQLTSVEPLDEISSVGAEAYWVFTRSSDFANVNENLYLAQVRVQSGLTQSGTTWYQTNQNILEMGVSEVNWTQGLAPAEWVRQVPTIAARNALDFQLNYGSQVLVLANPETFNRWTIWRWDRVTASVGTWTLVRIQGYRTPEAWTYEDWYALGFDQNTRITYTFDTLFSRDQFLDAQPGDVALVRNTGNGVWALYQKTSVDWQTVGVQNGNIILSDRLWDYEKYQMGFDGGGFDSTGQGYEYDSRLELNQIFMSLWNSATGTGFLLQNSQENQPNQMLFVMVNHALSEQPFVDWVFKTSFINIRGFSDNLEATPYYNSSKRESIVDYITEVKPYHVKIREFVDTRQALSVYDSRATDFDKPPYQDAVLGVRILNPENIADQVLLSNRQEYKDWYQNYQTNPELIRKLKTIMYYDRVACAPWVEYAPGYNEEQTPDRIVNTLVELYQFTQSVLAVPGVLVKVNQDYNHTWAWYVRNSEPYSPLTVSLCWTRVAFQHDQGAADRIQDYYTPGVHQTPKDSNLLISGCAGDLVTLDGNQFTFEDAWDQSVWDNVRGWSYTGGALTDTEITVQGGAAPQYITLSGTGSETEFSLPWAPQDPNNLRIWVSGVISKQGLDWSLSNHVSLMLISVGGVGYKINDVITVQGGVNQVPASAKVTAINVVGSITQLVLENPGSYTQIPNQPTLVSGGSGVGATVLCRWAGRSISFTQPPPLARLGANIWIVESGSTFNPAVSSVLDVVMDGRGLNRPHSEPGHPEELEQVWLRDSLILDVYTSATSGWGAVLTREYEADTITDQFDIGQPVWSADQLWVYVAGRLQTYGSDYVVNMEYMRVVFTQPPQSGRVSILSVGVGGASRSMGVYSILDGGANYELGDVVQMTGGTPSINAARVQVTAVSADNIQITQGGQDYQPGDILYYRYGAAQQTLSMQVLDTDTVNGVRGVITQVQIISSGYYTSLTSGVDDWFTSGMGTGAQFVISWAVAQIFPIDRGLYYREPTVLTQDFVVPSMFSSQLGTGLVVRMLPGVVREVATLVGDGVTNEIILSKPAYLDTVLVTLNGDRTFDYTFDGEDPRRIGLSQTPGVDDVVIVVVFDSSLFSLNSTQRFVMQAGENTYTLVNPPGYSPAASKNTQVYVNQLRKRAPEYHITAGTGSQTQFVLPWTPSDANEITVWLDNLLVTTAVYSVSGNQINFVSAPSLGTTITVQYASVSTQNHDYVIVEDQITIQPWAALTGDQIDVVVFTEDSHTSWVTDRFVGNVSGVYVLSQLPMGYGSVQVFVDGVQQSQSWDYYLVQQGNQTQIVFGNASMPALNTVVEASYPTAAPAQPPVAFRQFVNIYEQTQYLRLSDQASTRLVEPLWSYSTSVLVADVSMLAPATTDQPGAVWIGAERVEYTGVEPAAQPLLPRAGRLVNLRRGTVGTPGGGMATYDQVFHSGDGRQSLFRVPWALGNNPVVVIVDNVILQQGQESDPQAQYTVVINPTSRVPGVYVQFWSSRVVLGTQVPSSVPEAGSQNIQILQKQGTRDDILSAPENTVVRDATINQQLPGGYRWPSSSQGIQYGIEPQTAFLLAQPGIRRV
jgi:hypothetical protein